MTDLSFFVLPDDGLTPLLDAINQAQRTLDIYIFKMENQDIEQALGAAVKRGVQVRAILDKTAPTSEAAYQRLQQAGLTVKWAPSYFVKSHAKCFVADDSLAAVFSLNFVADWQTTRDYGITTSDQAVIAAVNACFNADWEEQQDQPTVAECAPLIVCPANSRAAVLDFIHQAKSSLLVEHEQFGDPQVINALAVRANAGVVVRMALSQGKSSDGATQLCQLAPGAQVVFPQLLQIHAKLIIRDDTDILLGSTNLTTQSLDQRREVSIVVTDPDTISRAAATFQADFTAASRQAGERPASGLGSAEKRKERT
jgi:phosphatidylserine/phosphatidylglycerophosphate/cardiolipin synthase-like enzyme